MNKIYLGTPICTLIWKSSIWSGGEAWGLGIQTIPEASLSGVRQHKHIECPGHQSLAGGQAYPRHGARRQSAYSLVGETVSMPLEV